MLDTPPVTLAICPHFLPEAEVLIQRHELKNITLISWRATCRRSLTSWDEVMSVVDLAGTPTHPLIIIGSCFSRALGSQPEALNQVHLERLDHCFDLICSQEMVADLIEEGAYLVSSGWLRDWRQTLQEWGFDQPLARQFFRETASKIVLLNTGISAHAETELEAFAAYIDLPGQQIRVGLDHFFWRLAAILGRIRGAYQQHKLLQHEDKLAQYELSLNLLNNLTDSRTEQEAVDGLVETFHILFAPHEVQFHRHLPPSAGTEKDADWREHLSQNHYLTHESQDGFWIVLKSGAFVAGYLNVTRVQLADYLHRYLNLALAIAPLCALAISRGRYAEQRQQDMATLQLKNEEIEQFVDVVSHDLKSPVVTIRTFLEMLQQDIATSNPQRVDKDINFMRGAIDKMDMLINALLHLSETGQNEAPPQPISLQSLIDSNLAGVAGPVHQHGIDIQVKAEDMELFGDPLQLGQIWQNLIENAIKYRGDHPTPTITIGVDKMSSGPEFYVRDNGIGVAPKHLDRIFGLFSQLNPQSDGSGLGLALVKKIVEHYQGTIRVESDGEGKGSCFRFTLPAAIATPKQHL